MHFKWFLFSILCVWFLGCQLLGDDDSSRSSQGSPISIESSERESSSESDQVVDFPNPEDPADEDPPLRVVARFLHTSADTVLFPYPMPPDVEAGMAWSYSNGVKARVLEVNTDTKAQTIDLHVALPDSITVKGSRTLQFDDKDQQCSIRHLSDVQDILFPIQMKELYTDGRRCFVSIREMPFTEEYEVVNGASALMGSGQSHPELVGTWQWDWSEIVQQVADNLKESGNQKNTTEKALHRFFKIQEDGVVLFYTQTEEGCEVELATPALEGDTHIDQEGEMLHFVSISSEELLALHNKTKARYQRASLSSECQNAQVPGISSQQVRDTYTFLGKKNVAVAAGVFASLHYQIQSEKQNEEGQWGTTSEIEVWFHPTLGTLKMSQTSYHENVVQSSQEIGLTTFEGFPINEKTPMLEVEVIAEASGGEDTPVTMEDTASVPPHSNDNAELVDPNAEVLSFDVFVKAALSEEQEVEISGLFRSFLTSIQLFLFSINDGFLILDEHSLPPFLPSSSLVEGVLKIFGDLISDFEGFAGVPGERVDMDLILDPQLQQCLEHTLGDALPETSISAIESLDCNQQAIEDLSGIEQLRFLKRLTLNQNAIQNIQPLAELHNLQHVELNGNSIQDMLPLLLIDSLEHVELKKNPIAFLPNSEQLIEQEWALALLGIPDFEALEDIIHETEVAAEEGEPDELQILFSEFLGSEPKWKSLHLSVDHLENFDLSLLPAQETLEFLSLQSEAVDKVYNLSQGVGGGLSHLTQLKTLKMALPQVEGVEELGALPELQWLELETQQPLDLRSFASLSKLQYLELKSSSLLNTTTLSELSQLQALSLDVSEHVDLSQFIPLPQLQFLKLKLPLLKDLHPLAELTRLEWLGVDAPMVSHLGPLAQLTQLTHVVLNTAVTDFSVLSSLPHFEQFQEELNTASLDELMTFQNFALIDFRKIQDPGLKACLMALESVETIKREDLSGLVCEADQGYDIAHLEGIEQFTNLKHLILPHGRVSDLSPLTALPELISLNLAYHQITSIDALAQLPLLIWLNLSYNHIEDIQPLSQVQFLWVLELSGNPITNLSPLQQSTSLLELGLFDTPELDLQSLAHILPFNLKLSVERGQSLDALSSMSNLSQLILKGETLPSLEPIQHLPLLKVLHLHAEDSPNLEALSTLPRLSTLRLHLAQLNDLQFLEQLPNLIALTLDSPLLDHIEPLAQLPHLFALRLSSPLLIDLSPLSSLEYLGFLDIHHANIDCESVKDLKIETIEGPVQCLDE